MNGPHDLGGRHGFGPVLPEDESIRFHADWEKRVLGVTLAAGALGYWNIDVSRHARESLPPAVYLNASYYEIWLRALETLLQAAGEITSEELAAGRALAPGNRSDNCLGEQDVAKVLAAGGPTNRPGPASRYEIGQSVRTKNHQPAGHCRLPSYARGSIGTIVARHGPHVFADTNARHEGENPCPLYTVRFEAKELFGSDGDPTQSVSIDVWEPYLEPA